MSALMDFLDFSDEEIRVTESSDEEPPPIMPIVKLEVNDEPTEAPEIFHERLRVRNNLFDDAPTRKLFQEWGLQQEAIDRLIGCGIKTDTHLMLMHHHHIDSIFLRDEQIGDIIIFTGKLQEWRMRQKGLPLGCCSMTSPALFNGVECTEMETSAAASPVPFDPPDEATANDDQLTFNLQSLLCKTAKGQQILSNYARNGYLTSKEQAILCHIIIDYHMSTKMMMSRHLFELYSSEIIKLFPSETIETYYMHRKFSATKNTAGKLYDRYRNMSYKTGYIKNLGKSPLRHKRRSPQPKHQLSVGSVVETESPISQDEYKLSKEWLRLNSNPWDKVLFEWRKSASFRMLDLRCRSIWTNEEILSFLNEWPRYRDPKGYYLVEIDFDFRHPGKKYDLISNFRDLHTAMKPIIIQEMKEKVNHKMLEEYFSQATDLDSMDCLLIRLIHALIPPARQNSCQKPSVTEAQEDFVTCFPTVYKIGERVTAKVDKHSPEPRIFVVGPHYGCLSQFYVFFCGILYKQPTFIKSLDLALKIYAVFNMNFSQKSRLVWSFLYSHFFKLEDRYIAPKVLNLINKVNNLALATANVA
ncbi:uncharacterized protein LOC129792922 [Lutzomyia longipalpis]|uniref:uncharacterized protein LOC129792922 n=1 Tax=Lutzomyia longipalpis TaxID=7200 RepID=UPI00248433D1|nr:uncharacterized protein LOC129792922 [Lutzomyia longipalpis]